MSSSVGVWAKVPWKLAARNLWISTDKRRLDLENALAMVVKCAFHGRWGIRDQRYWSVPEFQRQLVWKCMTAPAARTWQSFSQLPLQLPLLSTLMSLADRTVPVCRWRWRPPAAVLPRNQCKPVGSLSIGREKARRRLLVCGDVRRR